MEQLCLKWSNYQSSVSTVFQDLRETEQFTDVTISTTEGNSMRAHRVVICAASSYFRDILSGTNCWQHPVIILKDLPYPDLVSILEFIYTGSVSIPPDRLQSLLQTAKFLCISGLSSNSCISGLSSNSTEQASTTCPQKRKSGGSEFVRKFQKKEVNGIVEKSQEEVAVKMEPLDIGPEELTSSYARVDPFEESIGTEHAEEEVIPQEENVFDTSRDITENIYDDNPAPSVDRETAGDTGPLTCLVCRASLSNCNALYYHMNYVHSGGVEPGDIIRNIGTVLGTGGEGVKTEGRE
eukprot:TRINITY_DN15463_c0_g1_i1.p1 TRINITY_DN15463_c0_g1~~TRINITY_DN15463_c0_g1_i1.p1  ORF type:complete len:295 (-),score=93.17 TRINITY_DN15463_c0_g1_i1:25-909(-)